MVVLMCGTQDSFGSQKSTYDKAQSQIGR